MSDKKRERKWEGERRKEIIEREKGLPKNMSDHLS